MRRSTIAVTTAIVWLRAELESGPKDASAITSAAQQRGIAERALRRACRELQVLKERTGFGPGGRWTWSLPAQQERTNEIVSADESERTMSFPEPKCPSMADRRAFLRDRARRNAE